VEAEAAGAMDEALGWWARAVAHDPVSSRLVLQQVRVLAAMGDRANAIRVAEGHVRRLRDELDLEPDPEILATVERIRRGELPAQPGGAPPAARTAAARPSPPVATPRLEPSSATPDMAAAPPGPPPVAPAGERRVPRWLPWAAGIAAIVTVAGIGAGSLPGRRAEAGAASTSIAVLPFRNLSEDSSHAFFAEGLHDELQTQLAKVASLRVIGRTSVHEYEGTPKPLSEIGEELAVGSVVEAGVQVVDDRLRVTVRLLDPATGEHRWAERYDRTLDDAFAVQSDIAQRIVAAVGATLTSAEDGAIAAPPTRDAGAYEYYLQGLAYHRRPGFLRENYRVAQQLYERALAADSGFALAHAALASLHVSMLQMGHDYSPERMALARRAADAALRLGPGLPQVHLAAALIHGLDGRFRDAVDQLDLGLRGAPSDPELWFWYGIGHRGLGNWDSAVAAMEHARRLDPRDANLSQTLGDTYHYLRRYPEAIEAYRHASAFAPDLVQPRLSLAYSYFLWRGELDTLRAVLDRLPVDGSTGGGGQTYGDQRLIMMLWERRPDSLLSLLRAMGGPYGGDDNCCYRAILAADAHRLRGDTATARAMLDSVLALLGREGVPDYPGSHALRGMALATLGRRDEALREERWIERNEPADRYNKWFTYSRARILARLGEADAAFPVIERLLAGPSLFSVHELRISPEFDPIRSDPRYNELLRKYLSP
jgi:TolB-like protein